MIRTLIKLFISDCDLRSIPLGISGILGLPAIEESMALTSVAATVVKTCMKRGDTVQLWDRQDQGTRTVP
jgi:hypothetical protein